MRFKQPYSVVRRAKKTGSAVFFYRVYDPDTGKRLEYSTGRTSRAAARYFCEELQKAGLLLPKKEAAPAQVRTFSDWAKGWWGPDCPYCTSQEARGRKLARTYKAINHLRLTKNLLPVFGNQELKCISAELVEKWLLSSTGTPRVKNTALQVLRTMLGEAERLGLIPSNPVKRVRPIAEKRKTRDLFSPREVQTLFQSETADRVWQGEPQAFVACLLAACTAMRAGEILGLQVTSLHLEGDLPWVSVETSWDRKELKGTKTGVNRKVPIPATMVAQLKRLPLLPGFVFSDDGGKTPISYFRLRKSLQCALARIGISEEDQKLRGLGLHAFRHWVNTSLRGKVTDDVIRAITGHVSEEMTEHYTSHRIEDLRPAMNVISAVFGPGKARGLG